MTKHKPKSKSESKSKWLIAIALVAIFMNSFPYAGLACGPFIAEALLAFDVNPDFPLKRYVTGELGILRPTFAKSYLVVAYRYLSNKPLTKPQETAVLNLWDDRISSKSDDDSGSIELWTKPREKVPGTKPVTIESDRRVSPEQDSYDTYINCNKGSFENAAKILASKITKHGITSPFVKDWVAAQDSVFCHCGSPAGKYSNASKTTGVKEPPFPDVPKTGDAEVLQDRTYQHAAAFFYAQQFDGAFAEFKEIASQPTNPYAVVARYMMPRCLVRKSTLTKMDDRALQSTLSEASALVRTMLGDAAMNELHSACLNLLGFIAFRSDPANRLKELSNQVLSQDKSVSTADFYRSVDDYTLLLLKLQGGLDDPYSVEAKVKRPIPAAAKSDDLSDWITIWEQDDKVNFEHALEQWHKSHSDAWLLAALHLAPNDKAKTDELLAAAKSQKLGSPGYLSMGYEACRLHLLRGETEDATKEALALKEIALKKQMWSAANLLMDLRGKMPINQEQFAENSIRRPAALAVFDEYFADEQNSASQTEKKEPIPLVFAYENARFVNERMPLSVLVQICLSTKLPKKLRADAEQAAWVRAVVLNDKTAQDKVAPAIERDYPNLVPLLKATESGAEAARRFAAAYLILKNPGMRPYITGGAPRGEDFGKLDTYSDNWWDSTLPDQDVTYQEKGGDIVRSKLKPDEFPRLLTAEEAKRGVAEIKQLLASGSAPTYLCAQIAEFAAKNQSDPRVPEALHLAVRASRYGHKESRTTPFSKSCFQLLHKNYPKSPYSAKTPYYY